MRGSSDNGRYDTALSQLLLPATLRSFLGNSPTQYHRHADTGMLSPQCKADTGKGVDDRSASRGGRPGAEL